MNYTWKIEGVYDTNGLITQAKYHVCAKQKDFVVETEGIWFFKDAKLKVPYADVTEEMVISWIKAEDNSVIENGLANQIANLSKASEMSLPWAPQVFTPKFEEQL